MISIGISEFRANMNAILQLVQKGEIISLQARGTEVAKLVPSNYAQAAARKELEIVRETAVVGDVLSPIDEEWAATE